jgi:hypothetical protein
MHLGPRIGIELPKFLVQVKKDPALKIPVEISGLLRVQMVI